jgi:hypothetical protein
LGKFADYLAPKFPDIEEPKLTDYKKLSVAWCIQRFIEEMDGGVKPLGQSHRYILRMLQRSAIGTIGAMRLKRKDVIEHCKARQAQGVKPQTVQQDTTYLSGVLKYAGSAPHWGTQTLNLIGKS